MASLAVMSGNVVVPGPTGTTIAVSPGGRSQQSLVHKVGIGVVRLLGKSSTPKEIPPLTGSSAAGRAVFRAVHLSVVNPVGFAVMLPDLSMTRRMSTSLVDPLMDVCPQPSPALMASSCG